MGLTAQLDLNCRPLGAQFLMQITGPQAALSAVAAPASGAELSATVSVTAQISLGPVSAAVLRLVERTVPLTASLPDPEDVLRSLTGALELIERLTADDL